MDNQLKLEELDEQFSQIEDCLKRKIGTSDYSLNEDNLTLIQLLTNELDELARRTIDNVYLLSVSILIDDFFQITFAENRPSYQWFKYALNKPNAGIIADCCQYNQVSSFTREELGYYKKVIPQRGDFLNSEVKLYSVSPVYVGSVNVGCIILSLKETASISDRERVEVFLTWLSRKIEWVLYSEFVRVNGILEKCMFLHNALDCVDEYQSYHSISVSKLANMFGFIINQYENYRNVIKKAFPNFNGVDIFRIRLIGLTHDIGKVNMSEFEDIKSTLDKNKRALHPYFSYSILSKCGLSEKIAEAAGNHHESINSDGEPFGVSLHEEKTSVESQIVKFSDIIDSSIRERDNSFRFPDEKLERSSVYVAMDAVYKHKEQFDKNVYDVLFAILSSINVGELNQSFYTSFSEPVILSGVSRKTGNQKIILDLWGKRIDFSSLGRNKWVVIYASHSTFKQEQNESFYNDGIYFGLHFEKEKKQKAYDYCMKLYNNRIEKKNVVCAFISHSISRSSDFQDVMELCIDTMTQYLNSAPNNSKRWRLLRFDEKNRVWK